MLASLLVFPAMAADVDTWFGGGVSLGAYATPDAAGTFASTTVSQAEADARFATGVVYGRLDLDVHMDPASPAWDGQVPLEWAMLQVSPGTWFVRAGVTNPNIGLEDWDDWVNYLPTTSVLFDGASPGRLGGGEVGWTFSDGGQAFVFGGWDMDWAAPSFGGGYASEQDAWSTWSGLVAQPTLDFGTGTPGLYGFFGALEIYPADALWLTLDGGGGVMGGSPFAGAQLIANVLPEAVVQPVARVEGVFDPDDMMGAPVATASVGARVQPLDWLRVAVEGKYSVDPATENGLGAFLTLDVWRPEPPPYAAVEEDEEDEEETPAEGSAQPGSEGL